MSLRRRSRPDPLAEVGRALPHVAVTLSPGPGTRRVLHELTRLASRYPLAAARLRAVRMDGIDRGFEVRALGDGGWELLVYPMLTREPGEWDRRAREWERTGFAPRGARSLESIVAHEWGHGVMVALLDTDLWARVDALPAPLLEITGYVARAGKRPRGEAGRVTEAIAEGVAWIEHGEHPWPAFVTLLREWLVEYGALTE